MSGKDFSTVGATKTVIITANPILTLIGVLGFPKIGAVAINASILLSGQMKVANNV